jgi:hypothetical protein
MNINRKIQLVATAVIANGALALGLLSPTPAFATTCGPKVVCASSNDCANGIQLADCYAATPPGCQVVAASSCYNYGSCGLNTAEVECFYKST